MLQYHWGSIVKKKFVLQTIFWHRLYPSLEWSPSHVREAPSGQIRHGMLRACQNTLRVKENGLVFAGLPCHSFIFLNLATSCRSATCPFGDQEKLYVRQSNGYLGLVYRTYIYIYLYFVPHEFSFFCSNRFGSSENGFLDPRLAARLLILCVIAIVRGVHWQIEQPSTSTFVHFPYLKWVMRILKGFVDIKVNRLWGPYMFESSHFISIRKV